MSSSNNNNNDHNRVEATGCLKSVPSSPANIYVSPPVLPTAGQVKHHQHRHNVKSRYEFLQTLGRGTYGKVKLARHKDSNKYVAIKAIRKDKIGQLNMTHIRREMEIVSQIHHPNIIKIHEVFENQEKIVIVMEYAAGGELYDYISKKRHLDEEETKHIFRQIVSAVRYCHKQGIVHRDLKLENILLDKHNKIKIADFGLANRFDENSKLKTFCGSPLYASPEIVTGTPYNGPEVDSWSLGVLLYALVYGTMPFDSNNYPTLSQKITEGKYVLPAVPSNAQELIDWLLQVDPKKRATIDEVHGHRWLQLSKETIANNFLPASNSPRIQYPHVVSVENSNNNRQQQYIMQQQQQTTTNNNNIVETPKSILKQPTIEVSSPPSPLISSTIPPQPSTVVPSMTSIPRQTPSSEAELEGQLAVVCGLHARDSLKLKNRALQTSVVAHKRRLLRAKRDRESGYYSSPERASQSLSSSSFGGPSTSPTSAGVSPQHDQALYVGGDDSLKVNSTASMPLSVKLRPPRQLTPNPGQLVLPTLERLASGDGSSNERSPRPQSAYSDSSILSSDSFSLCSFTPCIIDQPATMTPPMPSHMMDGSTPSRPMSMPILPDSLPDPTPDELEQQHSGTLSPKSEQLLRGLERILMPNGRYRQHLNSAPPALGGSDLCSEFFTTASSNHSSCYAGAAYVNSGYNNSTHNFPTTTYHNSSQPSYVLPPPPSYHAGGYNNQTICTTQQIQQHYYQQPQQYNYVQSNMMAATVTTSSNNNFGLPPPPSPQGYVHQTNGVYPVMNQQQQQQQQQQPKQQLANGDEMMMMPATTDNIYHNQFVSSNNDDSPPPQYTSVINEAAASPNNLLPTIEMSKNDWENPYKCPLGGATIRANLTADV